MVMTSKPHVHESWPARRSVPVRLELIRQGRIPQPVEATIIQLSREGAELRLKTVLTNGQQLWLTLKLGDDERWTTRRWLARVTCVCPSPRGWLARVEFPTTQLEPSLSHHVVQPDGRTKSYRFDRSWHSEPVTFREEPKLKQ